MLYIYCIMFKDGYVICILKMFKDGYVICIYTKFTVGFINTFSKASLSLCFPQYVYFKQGCIFSAKLI